jgi:ABC-2 type transport system ATP-binding protein
MTIALPRSVQVNPVVLTRNLQKHYGDQPAVRGLDLEVQPGEIFGLIGPDGAGKTTTFHILAGVMEPSGGEVKVLSRSPREARLGIGYLTQQFSLYLDLSLDENLRYTAGLRQVPPKQFAQRRDKYLRLMGLDLFGDRLAGQLSGGMKQKLALCCSLVAQPQLLLLDEPTTGVDPVSRREFWDVLATLCQEGTTIVVATPYLDEAERCHRVALIYDGRIDQTGTPQQLRAVLGLQRLEVRLADLKSAEQILEAAVGQGAIADVQTFGDRLDVLVPDAQQGVADVRQILSQYQLVAKVEPAELTLENVFVTWLRQQHSDPPVVPFPWQKRQRNAPVLQPLSEARAIAIGAKSLSKVFGNFQAVEAVNLTVRYGEIYGLLGANGAGKTTTIKMLCGLLPATSGEMTLAGERHNLRSAQLRRRIGYMSQKFTLYDDLSIVQNLEFYCGVYGVPRRLRQEKIDWVLVTCGLVGQEHSLTGRLPGGWKQRVAFGASVLHEPEILFLDEPTSGVDPLARRQFWRLIEDFARQGTAVLVTTHYLEEAEHCHRLGLMVGGALVAQGSPSQIKAEMPGQLIEISLEAPQQGMMTLRQQLPELPISLFGDRLHVVMHQPEVELEQVCRVLGGAGLKIHSLRPVPFSLEDAFIEIVKRIQQP